MIKEVKLLKIDMLPNGCRIGMESPVKICVKGFVPDLEWIARTEVED